MTVRTLTLGHFRSHRATTVEADAGVIAIYGANGAGKTNLLEAVSMLSPGRGLRRAAMEDLSRRPDRLGWRIAAATGDGHEIETRAATGQSRQVRIDGKAASQQELARILRIVWLIPAMDRLWIEGAEGRRRFLDRITLAHLPAHADATLAYDRAMRERNRLFRDDIHDSRWLDALEARMATAGTELRANRAAVVARLNDAQRNASTAFPVADLALADGIDGDPDDRNAVVRNVVDDRPSVRRSYGGDPVASLAEILARGRREDRAAGRALVGPHRADLRAVYVDKGAAAEDCSTGEQKALLISLVLANARILGADTGQPPVILLDEVAAHLDPGRRAALFDEVTALRCQAWMTATERSLFDGLGRRTTILHCVDDGSGSRVDI